MKPEIFFLPHENNYILYAPLKKFFAVVNGDAKAAVAKKLEGLPLHAAERGIVEELEKRGLFGEDSAYPQVDELFAPTRVTLFPTDKCNLRCRYCYASAEDGSHTLPLPAARAAIDLVASNAKKKKHGQFAVGFHGNGEPFAAFDVVQECCDYVSEVAERLGIKYAISAATNGILSEDRLDFLLAWVSDVNVSSDILPDIQNSQRPTADGADSFAYVDRTLRRLNDAGVQYGIRATVTSESVCRLREMAAFVKNNYPKCNLLHFEPVFEVGRALENKSVAPDPKTFVSEYVKAQNELDGSGIRAVYSGERLETICQCFCSVCSNGFTVTAEGYATSCYEICTYKDPRAPKYIYGRYDEAAGKFDFDGAALSNLLNLQVGNMPFCADCFCKWHCGGDCAAKLLGDKPPSEHSGSARCVINRALTYRQILKKIGVDAKNSEPVFL